MATPKILLYEAELRAVRLKRNLSRPVVYTNDLNSAEFQFKVIDMDAGDLSTATATTLLYMRDGSFFQNPKEDVSLVGTTFSYTLKENEGNHAGIAKIQLIVTIGEAEYATQLYEFEIINGLETKVAQEVMIYDWTTLTRDAQDYIDQFVSNEATRQQQFSDAQMQRGTTFGDSEAGRTTIFNASEAGRTTTFNESEAGRTTAFNAAEEARATGYDADHSRAGTDHTTAVNDHTLAGTDHTTAANDHTLAGTDHTRAESDHTRADADSATVAGFNTRLTAEETATANNKISAVKAKTFADVDARFEDVETDTTVMGTNIVPNGDFSNGTTGWSASDAVNTVSANTLINTGNGAQTFPTAFADSAVQSAIGKKVYVCAQMRVTNANCSSLQVMIDGATAGDNQTIFLNNPVQNTWYKISGVLTQPSNVSGLIRLKLIHQYADSATANGKVMESKYIIAIDLTNVFGAGNEPTAEQMDGIMAKFTNSWFDGTKNLFRANATLNKLMAVDARTEFEAKSVVVNGDFSGGTTGWDVVGLGSLSASANVLTGTIVTDGVGIIARNTSGSLKWTLNNKYYSRAMARTIDAGMSTLQMREGNNTDGLRVIGAAVASPVLTQWYTFSDISSPTALNSDKPISVWLSATGVPTNRIEVKNVIVIDLTAAFGAGKEPTLAEMDRLMARFPNSWFDGVKPIQTIETLYQEKANKVQEAWITPTLLNGATGNVQYRKNEFGRVEFKGKLTVTATFATAFNLPTGYQLGYDGNIPVKTGTTTMSTAYLRFISNLCYLQSGALTEIDFSGISYVAGA